MLRQQRFQFPLRHDARTAGGAVCGDVGVFPVHQVGVEDHSGEVAGEPGVTGAAAERPDPLERATLHLHRGRQQTATIEGRGGRDIDRLCLHRLVRLGLTFDHLHFHPGQRQLPCQHQADRSGAGHCHVITGHHPHRSIYEQCSCQLEQ